MRNDNLEMWWASLTIAQKERIARKGLAKASSNKEGDEELVRYPACSRWWNTLNEADKQKIHDHCVSHHGYLLQDWNEADPYGD